MTKTLARHVHVRHPVDGEVHRFAPGEQVPEWAQRAITNPKAWGDDGSPSAEEVYAAQTAVVPTGTEGETPPKGDVVTSDAEDGTEAPPRGGRRAGRQNNPAKA